MLTHFLNIQTLRKASCYLFSAVSLTIECLQKNLFQIQDHLKHQKALNGNQRTMNIFHLKDNIEFHDAVCLNNRL